jgi:hypothetical protein
MEIPLAYGAILLRYALLMTLLCAALWLYRQSFPPSLYFFAVAAAAVTIQIGRYLVGRGPGIVMDSIGVSIRPGIWFVTSLSWADITGFDLKGGIAGYYLVICVKNPEDIRATQNAYGRYAMGQRENMFGSPVCIPTFVLKGDSKWLLKVANEFRAKLRQKLATEES